MFGLFLTYGSSLLNDHPSLVQKLCLKKRLGHMKQSFIENIRPGVRLELKFFLLF